MRASVDIAYRYFSDGPSYRACEPRHRNYHHWATTEGGAAMTMTNANRRGRQFTPERLQQIRNLVERGKSREEIAELIGVTVGSLQDVCSRFGIDLRLPLPPINGQSQQNSQSGPVEQPQATTPHEERARTDEMGLANLVLRMKR